ncbi:MAG: hypothetical protein KF770_05815 [Anaerolineae bacterium]|nr:hypothetical protein [Anaerolineae bacterium]
MLIKMNTHQRVTLPVVSLCLLVATFFFLSTRQVHADPITEVEPNDSSGTAQTLTVIGRENYVIASTNPGNDRDWYKFTATAGQTYVIEIFEASASLNVGGGSNCQSGQFDEGLGLKVYDSSITQVAASCEPNDTGAGAGNVHNIVQFTTGISGEFYVQVIPNNGTVTGDYKLRVLYQYDHPAASWDSNYEPNNRMMSAAPIQIGRENDVSTTIEQRIVNYATNFVDVDWFRFEAIANKTYVVEIFNADVNFNAASGANCISGRVDEGVGLRIYDASGTEIISSCEPNDIGTGSGNVHNIVQFTPGLAGTYFIKVIPNESNRYGSYKLRVLPQYDDPDASWDGSYEPNNRRMNAAEIVVGYQNAIHTNVEERIVNYSTNYVDTDWYYFEAVANETYVIEVFNADINFDAASGSNCVSGRVDEGIGLRIYDDTGTLIADSCEPNDFRVGSGNVHNVVQFTPGLAGSYFIKVIPNNNTRHGNYSLRVLPPHNSLLASWDGNYEPNNRPVNGYLLQPGQTLNTNIEARSSTYSTNFVDRDWYRVEALAGQSYTIETVNVAPSLATTSGSNCQGSTRTGLGIIVYDPSLSTQIVRQCSANGTGNVHTTATFEAGLSGTYYVWVLPNSSTASGNYSVRLGGFSGQSKVYLPMVIR